MSAFDKLIGVGAQVVGGDVIYKNEYAGHFKNGVFVTTDFGDSVLAMDIQDVVAKPIKTEPAAPAASKRTPRLGRAPEPVDVVEPSPQTTSVVDLLKDE